MNSFVKVIPLIKLPKKLGIFDYRVSPAFSGQIQIGQIVSVPFRNATVFGVVIGVSSSSNFNKKNLKYILDIADRNFLASYTPELIIWMSKYYFSSPTVIAKTVIPKIMKRAFVAGNNKVLKIKDIKNSSAEKIFHSSKNYIVRAGISDHSLYISLSSHYVKNKKQVLIILPELSSNKNILQKYTEAFGENQIAVIDSSIADGKRFVLQKQIAAGDIKVIVGARMSVFAPLKNPGIIIVDSCADQSLRQWDKNPRYGTVEVAKQISELTGCKLFFSDVAPFVSLQKDISYEVEGFCPLEVLDMKDERKKENHSFFSEVVKNIFAGLKKEKKQAVVFVNQKGSSSFVVCKDCGNMPTCDSCEGVYRYIESHGTFQLFCVRCKKKKHLSLFCDNCKSTEYKYAGLGDQKVLQSIKKEFPDIRAELYNADKNFGEREGIVKKYQVGEIDLIISTSAIFSLKDLRCDYFIFLSGDKMFSIPDTFGNQKAFRLIRQAQSIAREKVFFQMYQKKNMVLQFLENNKIKDFYDWELEQRKIFSYPPYSTVIKIIVQNKISQKAEKDAEKICREIAGMHDKNITISEPVLSFSIKVRGFFRYHIILRLQKNADREKLSEIFDSFNPSTLIEVDPDSLL